MSLISQISIYPPIKEEEKKTQEPDEMELESLDTDESNIKLIKFKVVDLSTNNYCIFNVFKDMLLSSNYFKTLIECYNDDNEYEYTSDTISIDGMKILLKFLFNKYSLESTNDDIKIKRIDNLNDLFKQWECEFIEKVYQYGYLNEVLRISNYFDVKILLYLACAKSALLIRNINTNLINKLNTRLGTADFDNAFTLEINNNFAISNKSEISFDTL